MSKVRENYNEEYFNWYRKIGEFGGNVNKTKFEKYIKEEDCVLDFGCGGGYLINKLNCKEKHGVEINPLAIKEAEKNSIKIFKDSNELSENYYDKIISNNSLQHCENPYLELKNLYKALKKNGLIIIVTSCSSINLKYKPNDINYQLYSWSPMNIGNLFDASNFEIISVKPFKYKWIPKYKFFYELLGKNIFNILCRIYGLFDTKISQTIAVGKKN